MASSDTTVNVQVTGVWGTVQALRRLPGQADDELRDARARLAERIARDARTAARSDSRQAALMAPTIRVLGGRGIPQVVAGGSTPVGRRRAPAYKILFGSEFGSDRYRQFRPHLGAGSYWFFAAVEYSVVEAEHERAADRVEQQFDRGV